MEEITLDRIAVIADDLTGASDSGVQFARKGLRTQVIFDWLGLSDGKDSLDTVVIDTDSRSIPGSMAYDRVSQAAYVLKQKGFTSIYKKLDSTLRGNLGQEIKAVMDVYGFEAAAVVPAFPRIGRTTVDGKHYLNGVPVHETEIGRDPKTPVQEADIKKLLAAQSDQSSISIDLSTLRGGQAAVQRCIEKALVQHVKLLIFDAETEEDMQMLARLVPVYDQRFLWVGSAGFAEYLPVSAKVNENLSNPEFTDSNPAMLVAGSLSEVTREQVIAVNEQPDVVAVEMDPLAILASSETRSKEINRCVAELTRGVAKGFDASLHAGSSKEQVKLAKELGECLGLDSTSVSNLISDALGEITSKLAATSSLAGLVLTGGDTAKAVCRHLGVHGIELVQEVEPGIPLGRLLGGRQLMAVTKAGAFGTRHSLLHAMQLLTGKGDNNHE